ncbi:MAG: HDOD domain-containing protein [Deltaproteobacteria bacterium]|nr:HDOD domain-containing protein [Deltaproteobacteria bacterium]
MGALLDRFRRLWQSPERAAPAAARPAQAAVSPAPARPPAPPPDPFAAFAEALAIPVPPAPPPLPEREAADEPLLAELVLGHFRKNRPGPASAPSTSLRILNLVATPDADIGELARLVSADPALAAGVLGVANAAAYRGRSEVETVRDAIARLGFEEVARIAGAVSAKSLFSPKLKAELAAFGDLFGALHRRALTVASGAAWLALQRPGARSDRAFLGGMLHDVGKSIALRSVAALVLDGELRLQPGEPRMARLLDRVHLAVGAEVHAEWRLPQYLADIATRHHEAGVPAEAATLDLHVVRLAAAVQDLREEPLFAHRAAAEVLQSSAALGLEPREVRAFAAEMRAGSQRLAAAFGLAGRR